MTYFRRGQGGPLDDLSALAAAAAAGLATFYFVRVWLQREALDEPPGDRRPREQANGEETRRESADGREARSSVR